MNRTNGMRLRSVVMLRQRQARELGETAAAPTAKPTECVQKLRAGFRKDQLRKRGIR